VKVFILIALAIIITSLGSALYYLLKDRQRSPRTVKALTFRITLSIILFGLLLAGFASGVIKPHGLRPVYKAPNALPAPASGLKSP